MNGYIVFTISMMKFLLMQTLKKLLFTSPIAGNGATAAIEFNPQTKSVASDIEDTKITH